MHIARPIEAATHGGFLRPALLVLALLTATAAHAHLIVDMKVSIRAPAFVSAGQAFTYEVVVDDMANDNALGVVVADTLPTGVTVSGLTAAGWSCGTSKGVVTCSAELLTPGEHVIAIRVNGSSQSGALVNTAHVTSLGSTDLEPGNDDATNRVTLYDPARCTAAPPILLSPAEDAVVDSAVVPFAWTPSDDGAQSVVHAATEGAAEAAIATTSGAGAVGALDRGDSTWWVEAVFSDCPPVRSALRRMTKTRPPPFVIANVVQGLPKPAGLAFGPHGELYVTDEEDAVVRLIAGEAVTTIAGAGGQPGASDGQFARFNRPTGITVTPLDGFIYVADTGNNKVRILYTGGPFVPAFSVTDPALVSSPAAVAATFRGSIYVADTGNGVIRLLTPVPGTTGLFTAGTVAQFLTPTGVAVDNAGVVYVADSGDGSIQKIAQDGTVSTLATGFDRPGALALDPLGNLYVGDRGSRAVYKVAPSGLRTAIAQFGDPAGLALAADGSLYVADAGNGTVRRIEVGTSEPVPVIRRRAVGH